MSDESKYRDPGHELTDAKAGAVFWSGLALTVMAVVAFVVIYFLVQFLGRADEPAAVRDTLSQPVQVVPEPRLQVDPNLDYSEYAAHEDSLLNSYGWVVREAGVVRLPVERAMTLMLERGYPVRQKPEEGR